MMKKKKIREVDLSVGLQKNCMGFLKIFNIIFCTCLS